MTTGPIRLEAERRLEESADAALKKSAGSLFELDNTSRLILANVARGGPQTIYELDKHKALSKAAIHRRLFGNGILLDERFLRLEGKVSFDRITGYEKKYYGLDLKGFLASLSEVKCKDNYMFNVFVSANYRHVLSLLTPHNLSDTKKSEFLEQIKRQASSRVKVDLLNFFLYHVENGLPLTHIKNPIIYVLHTNFFDSKSPIVGRKREDSLPNGVARLYEEKVVFSSPAMFESIWLTAQECKGADLPVGFRECVLAAYEEEIGKLPLRKKKGIPWDYGMLLVGKPIQKLREVAKQNEETDSTNGDE